MSYHRKNGTQIRRAGRRAVGDVDPWANTSTATAPNPNTLPLCPTVSSDGWCRPYVGGSAEYHGGSGAPGGGVSPNASSSSSTVSEVGSAIGKFLGSLGKPAVPVVPTGIPIAPGMPGYNPYAQTGMTTTTKLALAGGAALLLVVIATR